MATATPQEHRAKDAPFGLPITAREFRIGSVVAAVALVAVGLIAVGALVAGRSSDLGLEMAKAGFQLLVLVFAGLGVTGALNWHARRQDERRRVNDAAVELLRELIDNYNRMKSTRRVLRALGLRDPTPGRKLSAEQAKEFERQMRTLVEVQLSFERVGREIDVRLEDAKDARKAERPLELESPQADLTRLESYLDRIVEEWEDNGDAVVAGGYDATLIAELPELRGFIKHTADDDAKVFRSYTSEPLRVLERFFRDRLVVPFVLKEPPLAADASPDRRQEPAAT